MDSIQEKRASLTFSDGRLRRNVQSILLQALHVLNLIHKWNQNIQPLQRTNIFKLSALASFTVFKTKNNNNKKVYTIQKRVGERRGGGEEWVGGFRTI